MEDISPPQLVYAGPLSNAQQAWSALRGHGVEAWLLNQNQGNQFLYGDVEVTVRAEDREKAHDVLLGMGLVPR